MSDMVKITLAHPIGLHTCRQLGIEEAEHPVGAELELHREQAHRLVSAGYVQGADPANFASIQAAMRPVKSKPAAARPSSPSPSTPVS
ncbi:hypothetical protein ABZ897_16305 [Nonomuraea sp. NPDC046802]|uniref:hypothetical protein n=1 Tax=Nonomuraea sp. NPDC046802 TaxID=3154919 RepID=UPI0033E52A5A